MGRWRADVSHADTLTADEGRKVRAFRDLFRRPAVRAGVYQAVVLGGVLLLVVLLVDNTLANLETRSIRTGFDFLWREAGFDIGETPILSYTAEDSYGRAFLMGIGNTLRVALLGIALATVIGVVMGIARLSGNWLIARMAAAYVEVMRNVPLLLQLLFWYGLISWALPPVRDALEILPGVFLSKGGLQYPVPKPDEAFSWMALAFVAAIGACIALRRKTRPGENGKSSRAARMACPGLLIGLPVAAWVAGGAPIAMEIPKMGTFRLEGGGAVSPEFLALWLALSLYTAGYLAEIVRSGIEAVPRGQAEAARALGLTGWRSLRFVILPQALRVIVPPTTSQYLNLTKNSSLAVAIGYPDLVSIGNTALNQTGQAIECLSIMMGCYLVFSLSISLFMNWYNARIALTAA